MIGFFSFPNPVNEKAARVVAGTVLAIVLLILATGWYVLLIPLAFVPAAGLESIFGYCIGCKIFRLLMRAGLVPEAMCADCADITRRLRTTSPSS
jgi:hypothetical protein